MMFKDFNIKPEPQPTPEDKAAIEALETTDADMEGVLPQS